MFEDHLQSRVDQLLSRSTVRTVLIEELSELCALKPADMSIGDFAAEVSRRLLVELHQRLKEECERRGSSVSALPVGEPAPELDFERIIHGLMMGMEHDLMVGNLQMVSALGGAIAQRDTGTSAHNARVTLYATRLGMNADLDTSRLRSLMKGSFVHDIGKVGIPDDILLKQGGLTPDERRQMNSHVDRGCKIISGVRWLIDARDVVRNHHEKYDGSGYPDGLAAQAIPINARLFAIADVFDALTSERPYKPANTQKEALDMMSAEAGSHFDPDLLDTFLLLAPTLYREITLSDEAQLETAVLQTVTEVFGVNPATDFMATEEFRRRYRPD